MEKTTEKIFDRQDTLSWISDLYKDVNGHRPRSYSFEDWSDDKLNAFTEDLLAELKENEKQERLQEIEDVATFKKKIEAIVEIGAEDTKQALIWMIDGFLVDTQYDERYVSSWDIDGFLYKHGIRHSDYGTQLREKLKKHYNA